MLDGAAITADVNAKVIARKVERPRILFNGLIIICNKSTSRIMVKLKKLKERTVSCIIWELFIRPDRFDIKNVLII